MTDASQQPVNTWAGKSRTRFGHLLRTSIGPLLLMLVTPPAAVLFWVVCSHLDGSLWALTTAAGWQAVVTHGRSRRGRPRRSW